LLGDHALRRRSAAVGAEIRSRNGTARAADLLERVCD
jgi:UDP:flavonoid glycosyltransferase YjiC (YdhE family)